jgi:hypothetical protein
VREIRTLRSIACTLARGGALLAPPACPTIQHISSGSHLRCGISVAFDRPVLRGLAPKVRDAVMRELGLSPREVKVILERGRTLAIRENINERKTWMRENNERPRGGVHEAAIAEETKELGMTPAVLKGRLRKKRLHP